MNASLRPATIDRADVSRHRCAPLPLTHSPALLLLLAIVLFATFSSPLRGAAAADRYDVISASLPKMVKLYGAGGYSGLEAYGTGFLVSADGLIATSWNTLLDADPITAVLDDGRHLTAELVAVDTTLGLALLKVDPGSGTLPHFDLSQARPAEPGDRVFAFSNMFHIAAGDEPVSVMHGSIIAHTALEARRGTHRVSLDVPVYLIDAVINNPGAAGGAIVGLDGKFVGMIGRQVLSTDTATWLNYALPAVAVRQRIQQMINGADSSQTPGMVEETPEQRRSVDLGLVLVPNVTARTPAYVTDVLDKSPGQISGFQRGDLIVFTGGDPTRSINDFIRQISRAQPGDDITIIVRRDGDLKTLEIEIP